MRVDVLVQDCFYFISLLHHKIQEIEMDHGFLDLSGPFDFDEFINYPPEDEREDSNRLGIWFFFIC